MSLLQMNLIQQKQQIAKLIKSLHLDATEGYNMNEIVRIFFFMVYELLCIK